MKNIKTLVVTVALLTTSCSLFENETYEEKETRIIYNNVPEQYASVSNEDAITKRESISVANVTESLDTTNVVDTQAAQKVIRISKEDVINSVSDPEVKIKRIKVEDVQGTNKVVLPTDQTITKNETVVSSTTKAQIINEYGGEGQPNSDAEVGQCYGKVKVAGTFKDVAERVVVEPARTRKKTIPAKYNYVNEEVVVREEGVKYIEIPATYKTVTETVVVEPEKKKINTIPARYKTVQERVLVTPARKVWKKGRGLIEKTDGNGDIMCLVEEPAKYETVSKQVLVEPERQEISIIPAVKKIITKEVIDRPAKVEKRIVPAVKKVISKKVLVEAERTVDVNIPATYKTVNKKVEVTPAKVTWRPVLCDYNITDSVVRKLQEALSLRGYDTGGVDGVFGSKTSEAVKRFQKSLGLDSSGITIETLRALGVSY